MWYVGVSKNNGTPISSILIGFSIINHPFWGTTIFGNTHITKVMILFEARVLILREKSLEREYLSAYNPGKLWSKDNILCAWKLSSHLDWRPQIWSSLDRGVKGLAEPVQCFQQVVTLYMQLTCVYIYIEYGIALWIVENCNMDLHTMWIDKYPIWISKWMYIVEYTYINISHHFIHIQIYPIILWANYNISPNALRNRRLPCNISPTIFPWNKMK